MSKKRFFVLIVLILSLSLTITPSTVVIAETPVLNTRVSYTPPTGYLDLVTYGEISGWAWRSDIPNTPIQVHIYIINNTTGAQTIIHVTANQYRQDLANLGYGNGYHGFKYDINWLNYTPGTYSVYAYGIGLNENNPLLNSCPKSFTVDSMTGAVDYFDTRGICGWGWKPDAPNSPVSVKVYINKANGTQVAEYDLVANYYRGDLVNSGISIGNGRHGFECQIEWSYLPREVLYATVYLVDGTNERYLLFSGSHDNAVRGPATLYGIYDEGHDKTKYLTERSEQALLNMGVTDINGVYLICSPQAALNDMQNSMIWIAHTHGTSTGVQFNEIINNSIIPSYLMYSDIAALPQDALSNTRLVIYGTCFAGQGGAAANNMVKITGEKGARTVMGWHYETKIGWMNTFLREFLVFASQGYTIGEAYFEALFLIERYYEGDDGGLGDVFLNGDLWQKLVS